MEARGKWREERDLEGEGKESTCRIEEQRRRRRSREMIRYYTLLSQAFFPLLPLE